MDHITRDDDDTQCIIIVDEALDGTWVPDRYTAFAPPPRPPGPTIPGTALIVIRFTLRTGATRAAAGCRGVVVVHHTGDERGLFVLFFFVGL